MTRFVQGPGHRPKRPVHIIDVGLAHMHENIAVSVVDIGGVDGRDAGKTVDDRLRGTSVDEGERCDEVDGDNRNKSLMIGQNPLF